MDCLNLLATLRCPVCDMELMGAGIGSGSFSKAVVCGKCYRLLAGQAVFSRGIQKEFYSESNCSICCFPLEKGKCEFCDGRILFFDQQLSLFRLNTDWTRVLHKWKFQNHRMLFKIFVPSVKKIRLKLQRQSFDFVGYIGSGSGRFDVRSYQPCEDLARFLGKLLRIQSGPLLQKKREKKQSSRDYQDRFLDIRDSMELFIRNYSKEKLPQRVLLVEDVFTTGATANEAARVLKEAGIEFVFVISMLQREILDFS